MLIEHDAKGPLKILAAGPFAEMRQAYWEAEKNGRTVALWPSEGRVKKSVALRDLIKDTANGKVVAKPEPVKGKKA